MKYPTRDLVLVAAMVVAACGDDDKATDTDAAVADAMVVADATVADAAPPDAAPVCGNGVREDGEQCDDGNETAGDGCEGCQTVGIPPTAFRVTSLELLEPHLMDDGKGACRAGDVTPFVNELIGATLEDGTDEDMLRDFAPVMVFRPLAPAAATTPADFVVADCTNTSPAACQLGTAAPAAMTATNQATENCLGPLAGTTSGYEPAVGTTPGPCFVTAERDLTLTLTVLDMPLALSLTKVQIAATYVGSPPTSVTSGLLRGFMSEAVANTTEIPTLGAKFSELLPGGAESEFNTCEPSDADIVDGVRGWWFYLAFTAEEAAWTDPPL